MSKHHKLFSVYGIEAEYMIVDNSSLKVKPIADQILKELNHGIISNEVQLGRTSCSNELVNHVLEVKCTHPESSLHELDVIFHESILKIQKILYPKNCSLMPTAMNPWFIPEVETVLWPHDQREIYHLYNEIFDCKGHGWSNLQSVHINLPYDTELEFIRLHSAIRIILPLIPFVSASSPFYENKKQKYADNRLSFYEKNQEKVPSIIGNIIPENVKSLKEYHEILSKIYNDISHYDHTKTLQNPWLNSRAAIPKFDVGAIEIRLMDIQESPYMDFSIIHFIVEMIKYVTNLNSSLNIDKVFSDSYLREIYDQSKEFNPQCDLGSYFELFNLKSDQSNFKTLVTLLINKFLPNIDNRYHKGLQIIQTDGSLSQRLIKKELSMEMYKKLIDCLMKNIPYEN
ncbi:MAG: glutamate--cysteine ligase [Bdellovibrionaceae bacterium]|nr:glutamate--cysteine ligase [Pseudobdellovibrionaceae bacterium]